MVCSILFSALSYLDNNREITVSAGYFIQNMQPVELSPVYRQSTGPLNSLIMSQESVVIYCDCCFPLTISNTAYFVRLDIDLFVSSPFYFI